MKNSGIQSLLKVRRDQEEEECIMMTMCIKSYCKSKLQIVKAHLDFIV